MQEHVILTILGPDRPGIVQAVSETVSRCGGNWLESQMTKLGGHFTGLARISCSSENLPSLEDELRKLSSKNLMVSLATEHDQSDAADLIYLNLDVIGNDRTGIIAEVSRSLRENGANIIRIETRLEAAPVSGHPIFHTLGSISLTGNTSLESLQSALEELSPDLQVELTAVNPES